MYQSIMFTHDDLDGAGCCTLFRLYNDALLRKVEWDVICSSIQDLTENIYNEIDRGNVVPTVTTIYFADICPSVQVAQHLIDQGFTIRVFDHHGTNKWICDLIEDAVVIPMTEIGVKECGTSLFYKYACEMAYLEPGHQYFLPDGSSKLLAEFVENVRLYDTFDWKKYNKVEPKQLRILFYMLGMDRFCDRYLSKLKDKEDQTLINPSDMDFVSARMDSEQNAIDKFTPAKVSDIDCRGRRVAFMIGSQGANFSDLSSAFLEKYPEYDATVGFYLSPRGGTFQIRGRGDLNLAEELAQPIGGGGHPGACGASLQNDYNDKIKEIILEYLTKYHV